MIKYIRYYERIPFLYEKGSLMKCMEIIQRPTIFSQLKDLNVS